MKMVKAKDCPLALVVAGEFAYVVAGPLMFIHPRREELSLAHFEYALSLIVRDHDPS